MILNPWRLSRTFDGKFELYWRRPPKSRPMSAGLLLKFGRHEPTDWNAVFAIILNENPVFLTSDIFFFSFASFGPVINPTVKRGAIRVIIIICHNTYEIFFGFFFSPTRIHERNVSGGLRVAGHKKKRAVYSIPIVSCTHMPFLS